MSRFPSIPLASFQDPLSSRESSDRWKSRSVMTGEWCQSRWSDNIYCGVSRVRVVELERFKRLVYTLHPKAASLRMHSMRKRKVTTKFTMVKKSNKTGGASWYYKIHPTHRRNTTQTLYIPLCVLHYSTSICSLSQIISLFDHSLRLLFVRVRYCTV